MSIHLIGEFSDHEQIPSVGAVQLSRRFELSSPPHSEPDNREPYAIQYLRRGRSKQRGLCLKELENPGAQLHTLNLIDQETGSLRWVSHLFRSASLLRRRRRSSQSYPRTTNARTRHIGTSPVLRFP